MSRTDMTVMFCRMCSEQFNVLREWTSRVRCPSCEGALESLSFDRQNRLDIHDPIGRKVGGCHILDIVGRGSSGAVYRAVHRGLRRDVAVKMLPVTPRNRPMLKRLVFEARTVAKLEHPNIVQVYDVGLQSPYLFIVMQLVRGRTLAEHLDRGSFELNDAIDVLKQIARGLVAAHGRGIIHRDLKPENILVTDEGAIKITDFGLALDARSLDDYSGQVVGTPFYIAPEVWVSQKCDERSDLYSLGAIAYHLVCGRRLFEAENLSELMHMHLHVLPAAPKDVNKSVPVPLSSVILKLLAKEPTRRYSNAQAFLSDLERYERAEDVTALSESSRFVKCPFCDSLSPRSLSRCKICGEDLRSTVLDLELDTRGDEFACTSCGAIVELGRRICPRCKRMFCTRCKTRPASLGTTCEFCFEGRRR